ncbi:amidohydrolase family protein [Daejeonella sp.]|uniref:amidohydrolase family protein n=1 Tax=Daejeonella sp. TaxID=2805397 RepID=UPI003983B8D7
MIRNNTFGSSSLQEIAGSLRRWKIFGVIFCLEIFIPILDQNNIFALVVVVPSVERLMFGSDWPVFKLAVEYDEVFEVIASCIEQLKTADQELIWWENAIKVYKLDINQEDFS